MFYDRGFEATSLRNLADAVGIQVASLYNHISSKEDLLFDIMREVMIQLLELTEPSTDTSLSPSERLLNYMTASAEYHATHRLPALIGNSELRSLSPEHHAEMIKVRNEYQSRLENALSACLDNGDIEIPNVKLAGYAGFGILLHVAAWYRPNGPLSLSEVIDGLLSAYAPTAQIRKT